MGAQDEDYIRLKSSLEVIELRVLSKEAIPECIRRVILQGDAWIFLTKRCLIELDAVLEGEHDVIKNVRKYRLSGKDQNAINAIFFTVEEYGRSKWCYVSDWNRMVIIEDGMYPKFPNAPKKIYRLYYGTEYLDS